MNTKIIEQFEKLADQIESEMSSISDKKQLVSESFRLRQVKNVVQILKKYPKKIKSGEQVAEIKGVGKHSVQRIDEILKTGRLKEIKSNRKKKKELEYIKQLEQVINIGQKKAIELVKEKNIRSVKQLKEAHEKGKIKLNDKILLGLKYFDVYKTGIPREEITRTERMLKKVASSVDKELFLIVCGSYRRLRSTSNDIDVLITHPGIKTMKQLKSADKNHLLEFVKALHRKKFLLDDLTDKNFTNKYMGFSQLGKNPVRRIDIRYVPYSSYYAALLYFTGSGNFNKKMREVAISLGYKLNEYGLFKKKGDRFVAVKINSERDVFDALGMEYLDPAERD